MRVMLRAQFMGVVRLAAWTGAFLLGLAGTTARRLDRSRWANRWIHDHAAFDAYSRQAQVSSEVFAAVDEAHHNGLRLIEQCEAGSVATSRSDTNVLEANILQ